MSKTDFEGHVVTQNSNPCVLNTRRVKHAIVILSISVSEFIELTLNFIIIMLIIIPFLI